MDPVITKYELADGVNVPLSLTYRTVLKIRAEDKWLYKEYNSAITKMADEPEYYQMIVLYAAYFGGAIVDGKDKPEMDFDEFVDAMNQNRQYNARIFQEIMAPNRKKASAKRS